MGGFGRDTNIGAVTEAINKVIQEWTFGAPTLAIGGSGVALWERSAIQTQKGASGWQAKLTGGAQSGDDWAAAFIPVNELPVPDFNSALWTYWLTNAEEHGFNIVIWMHDPTDNTKRAEVTQAPSGVTLARAQYWNGHVLNTETTQFFYFGEPDPVVGTGLTKGTQYTWKQYQSDAIFKDWTIYRISIEYGWYHTGTFEAGWLTDLKLNGENILLQPQLTFEGDELKVKTYAFSLGGVNFNDYSKIKTLWLPSEANQVTKVNFQVDSSDYTVPVGYVFVALKFTGRIEGVDTVARIGEGLVAGDIVTDVLSLGVGTGKPFMRDVLGVFAATKYIKAKTNHNTNGLSANSALYGVEVSTT